MTPLPDALAGAIADHIGQLDARYLDVVSERLQDAPITASELVAMIVLEAHPEGLTQTAWGKAQGVSRQRAHTITQRLEALGFLHLTRQGRASQVRLSPEGAAFLVQTRPGVEHALAEAMPGLSDAEGAQLLALLSKLLAG